MSRQQPMVARRLDDVDTLMPQWARDKNIDQGSQPGAPVVRLDKKKQTAAWRC